MTNEYLCDFDGCGAPPFFSGRELGGHRKTHNRRRTDKPDCFTDTAEWESAIDRIRVEHPNKQTISRDYALAESCAVCPLEFMQEMQARGKCHPPDSAIPQRDVYAGDDDE